MSFSSSSSSGDSDNDSDEYQPSNVDSNSSSESSSSSSDEEPTPVFSTSPVQVKRSGNVRYSSNTKPLKYEEVYSANVAEMDQQFIGPMPTSDFLREFVPSAPEPRPANVDLSSPPNPLSGSYENDFNKVVEDSGICPTLRFQNGTAMHAEAEQDEDRRADFQVFLASLVNETIGKKDVWAFSELWGEHKNLSEDPFCDPVEKKHRKRFEFQHKTHQGADKARGQMIAYAATQFASQHRVFIFSFLLMGDFARLLRWDRSAVIVTERFNWKTDPTLAEFFWRFSRLSDEQRGHDVTVCPNLTVQETKLARSAFATLEGYQVTEDEKLHRVVVHDDDTGKDYAVIIGSPQSYSESLTGRATFGYPAVDTRDGALVWLKDYWRVDSPEFVPEHHIYNRLAEHDVPYTARKVFAGDVGEQVTRSQDFVSARWACKTSKIIVRRKHYRLVINVVGRPSHTFKSSKEFFRVIRDTIEAHWIVFSVLKILHRDIHPGNILINADGHGILIDWDMSREVSEQPQRARLFMRSGMWQFISAKLASNLGERPHELSDDLESFVHVVVYNLFRYLPSEYHPADLVDDFKFVYDRCVTYGDVRRGGKGKVAWFEGSSLFVSKIRCLPDSCVNLLVMLRDTFRVAFYSYNDMRRDLTPAEVEAKDRAIASLSTSKLFLDAFKSCLDGDGWGEEGGLAAGVDRLSLLTESMPPPPLPVKSKKRKKSTKGGRSSTKMPSATSGTPGTSAGDESFNPKKRRRIVTSSKGTRVRTTGNELSEEDYDDD